MQKLKKNSIKSYQTTKQALYKHCIEQQGHKGLWNFNCLRWPQTTDHMWILIWWFSTWNVFISMVRGVNSGLSRHHCLVPPSISGIWRQKKYMVCVVNESLATPYCTITALDLERDRLPDRPPRVVLWWSYSFSDLPGIFKSIDRIQHQEVHNVFGCALAGCVMLLGHQHQILLSLLCKYCVCSSELKHNH